MKDEELIEWVKSFQQRDNIQNSFASAEFNSVSEMLKWFNGFFRYDSSNRNILVPVVFGREPYSSFRVKNLEGDRKSNLVVMSFLSGLEAISEDKEANKETTRVKILYTPTESLDKHSFYRGDLILSSGFGIKDIGKGYSFNLNLGGKGYFAKVQEGETKIEKIMDKYLGSHLEKF